MTAVIVLKLKKNKLVYLSEGCVNMKYHLIFIFQIHATVTIHYNLVSQASGADRHSNEDKFDQPLGSPLKMAL